MSFDPTSENGKAALYKVMLKVGRLNGHRALRALSLPFPNGWALSDASLGNLRKGQYDRHRARLMYDWLEAHHFLDAHKADKTLFPDTPDQRFTRFVDEHSVAGKLRIITRDGALGLVEHRSQRRDDIPTIEAGQEFWFELDVEEDGYVVAFQGYQGKWTQFPILDEEEMVAHVTAGSTALPRLKNGEAYPLIGRASLGESQFVFLVTAKRHPPVDLAELTRLADAEAYSAHKLRVLVEG